MNRKKSDSRFGLNVQCAAVRVRRDSVHPNRSQSEQDLTPVRQVSMAILATRAIPRNGTDRIATNGRAQEAGFAVRNESECRVNTAGEYPVYEEAIRATDGHVAVTHLVK